MTHKLFRFSTAAAVSIAALIPLSCCSGQDAELEKQAIEVLRKSCVSCHGEGNEKHGDIDFITDAEQLVANGLVDPETPSQSQILIRMRNIDDPMPPEDADADVHRPTAKDIEIIQDWIASLKGASEKPVDSSAVEPIKPLATQFPAIRKFLEDQPNQTAARWRFFSLENLHRLKFSENARNKAFQRIELNNHRAAVAKAVNSLSWASEMATIIPIGEEQVILALDISTVRDVGGKPWSRNSFWTLIESQYPYGLLPDDRDFSAIQKLTKTTIPVLRADWFIAIALRPPLYHELLGIPTSQSKLHEILTVTFEENILQGLASRVGFIQSGVSKNANRLIERHPSRYGHYWVSYDFLANSRRGNLLKFPTGPMLPSNPHNELAFEHDGGEIIFSLPNGLQGYMLVDKTGSRLDAGPAILVSDDNKVSGSPEIVNGVSCIACHRHGIYPFPKDEVGTQARVSGELLEFVQRLHDFQRVDQLKNLDRDRFLIALEKATGKWFRSQGDDKSAVTSFAEPITRVASHYKNSALGLAEVASELGLNDPKELLDQIENNQRLKDIGLEPLTKGGVVKRDFWESTTAGQSPFQQAARHMGAGVPIYVSPPQVGTD